MKPYLYYQCTNLDMAVIFLLLIPMLVVPVDHAAHHLFVSWAHSPKKEVYNYMD